MKKAISVLIILILLIGAIVPFSVFATGILSGYSEQTEFDGSQSYDDFRISSNSSNVTIDGEDFLAFESFSEEIANSHTRDYTVITSQYIPDGVYAIKNMGNSQMWMDVNGHVSPGYNVLQNYYSGFSPVESFDQTALFKISRVGETNRYIIRSMMNNRLGLGISGSEIVTKIIPADDSDVQAWDTFQISYTSSGYVIRPYANTLVVAAPNTMVFGDSGAPDSYLIKTTQESAGSRAYWSFEQYTGEQRSGVWASSSPNVGPGLEVDRTSIVSLYTWTTVINANDSCIDIPTTYSGIVSGVWDENTAQFELTALKSGKYRLRYKIIKADGNTLQTFASEFLVVPWINTSTPYYIENIATGKYVDIEGPSTSHGASIQQWDFNQSVQSRWIFESIGGGYYLIKSVYSNLYIGVDRSDTNYYLKQYSTASDYTTWYFSEDSVGWLKIHCKAMSSTYCITVPSASSGNGVNLKMGTGQNGSMNGSWAIVNRILWVKNYYDNTFLNSISDYNNKINQANEYLNLVYKKHFGIKYIMDGSASHRTDAPADQCPLGPNVKCSDDVCGADHSDHHKRLSATAEHFYYGPREDDHIYVLWAHRAPYTMCMLTNDNDNDGINDHVEVSYNGVVWNYWPVIQIIRIAEHSENYQSNMANYLVHEAAHTFHMDDSYNYAWHDEMDLTCIMGRLHGQYSRDHYDAVLGGYIDGYCSDCQNRLKNLIPTITIEGN